MPKSDNKGWNFFGLLMKFHLLFISITYMTMTSIFHLYKIDGSCASHL